MVAIKLRIMNFASNKLNRYLKAEKVIRDYECNLCGIEGEIVNNEFTLEGHHPDYRKPLFVIWLCRACHKQHHREMRLARIAATYKIVMDYFFNENFGSLSL